MTAKEVTITAKEVTIKEAVKNILNCDDFIQKHEKKWILNYIETLEQSLTELEELKKLQHIHIGIDCNNKDDTAIVIAQKRGDNVYVIYGKARFTELSIDLDEVVKVAEEELNKLKKLVGVKDE